LRAAYFLGCDLVLTGASNKRDIPMGMSVGENKGGAPAEMNVVPLII
jgi:hypothetical protein